ncbi:hypothetical protein ABW19_dt0204760 [Dactylella cylindrospora]|nr:hypothetical protein ABW19_dt0204760 [Dactylella cylindrospora]
MGDLEPVALLPMKVDAFLLNEAVCSGGEKEAKIAPITQPNYTFLRLDDALISSDILDPVNLHFSSPAASNTRYMDLGSREVRVKRRGVYIHWTIPRPYRLGSTTEKNPEYSSSAAKQAGTAAGDTSTSDTQASGTGAIDKDSPPPPDNTAARFQQVPTRWMVIRYIDDPTSIVPSGAQVPQIQAWIIESDRLRTLDNLDDDVDLQVDVSPYIYAGDGGSKISIATQAECFIGYKEDLTTWTEEVTRDDGEPKLPRAAVSLLNSSNQLFADYQPHNSNVLSTVDNFQYLDADGQVQYLQQAKASYYVLGWHPEGTPGILEPVAEAKTRGDLVSSLNMALADGENATVSDWLGKSTGAEILCHGAIYNVNWNVSTKPVIPADDLYTAPEQKTIRDVETSIDTIQLLLQARDDGVEAQRQAADILTTWNFERQEGGLRYFFSSTNTGTGTGTGNSKATGKPTQPSKDEIDALRALNATQRLLDAKKRAYKSMQWDLFSEWWKYMSDTKGKDKNAALKPNVLTWASQLQTLKDSIESLTKEINDKVPKGSTQYQRGIAQTFYQQRDPTLLVGGIQSGWPTDFLSPLSIRLDSQTVKGEAVPQDWKNFIDSASPKLPSTICQAASKLIGEFVTFELNQGTQAGDAEFIPLYHDNNEPDKLWRDQWNGRQPWFPLFLEWEVEYTHIPFNYWKFGQHDRLQTATDTPPTPAAAKIKYGMDPEYNTTKKNLATESLREIRTLSGRVLILPQSNFSLKAKIEQLLNNTPKEILEDAGLDDDERTKLLQNIDVLQISMDHSQPGMVPATHGQFKFTKINIIDKFGQAIHALDNTPYIKGVDPLYPCIGEFYEPEGFSDNPSTANTVDASPDGQCEYVQMPPQINQFARINASFVTLNIPEDGKPPGSTWRPMDEWENPIWGWVLVNYADQGIQLFQEDGAFYREVRFGGPKQTQKSPPWLPLSPGSVGEGQNPMLETLAEQLNNKDYLECFIDMINGHMRKSPPAPTSYAEFMNCVVGKPLALVNTGWSLELAVDSYGNQSSLTTVQPGYSLLDPAKGQTQYEFPIKLGDAERQFDGLVGYFNAATSPTLDNQLDLNKIYTYFLRDTSQSDGGVTGAVVDPRLPISTDTFPTLPPFWISPVPDNLDASGFSDQRNSKLQVFGALVDPFTAVHCFASILPIQSLALPPWTWQESIKKMTAFFHIGPMLQPADVPQPKSQTGSTAALDPDPNNGAVSIPVQPADWVWLQPYFQQNETEDQNSDTTDQRIFVPMQVDKVDSRPKFEKAPYTVIEGYLQMRGPLVSTGVQQTKAKVAK